MARHRWTRRGFPKWDQFSSWSGHTSGSYECDLRFVFGDLRGHMDSSAIYGAG